MTAKSMEGDEFRSRVQIRVPPPGGLGKIRRDLVRCLNTKTLQGKTSHRRRVAQVRPTGGAIRGEVRKF